MNSIVFTNQEGHLSIAQSLVHFLKEHQIESELALKNEPGMTYYKFLYQRFPSLFFPFYRLSKTKLADHLMKEYSLKENNDFVTEYLEKIKPSLVFSTSLGFSPILEETKQKFEFSFINIIPNPRTFFRQDAWTADLSCVFDQTIKHEVQKINQKSEVIVTGWFVRPEFEKEYVKSVVRKELGLNLDSPVFLFVSGSEGTEAILDQVMSVQNISEMQIIVACGNNQKLLQKVSDIASNSQASIKALSFTSDIYKYMQAADLVVGKAGPNMVFESIATHTPFFATTHIAGLENGNLDIIREYQLGFVEEDHEKVGVELKKIAENPGLLEEFTPTVKKLAEYNKSQRNELLKYLS